MDIDSSEYRDSISEFSKEFDLVLVDGQDRKNCVNTAYEHLAPGGVVFLHDAKREYYRCIQEKYPQGTYLTENLWQLSK